ncbi:MAG TPA: STAS domain-containing protein [Spirochaetota bacterium]|nr:STAS domain-containing protein [Spirochaetota bacterium]
MELNYSIEDKEGLKVINLDGNLSVSNAESLEKLIDLHTQKSSVIINMSDVRLVTSSGMNSLINVSMDARSRNNRVLLMKPNSEFRRMIDILKTYDNFIVVDSFEEGQMKVKYFT